MAGRWRILQTDWRARLGRPTSTVSREVGRHGWPSLVSRGDRGRQYVDRALRPQLCRLAQHAALRCVWLKSSRPTGRRNKSPAGSSGPTLRIRTCRYRTRDLPEPVRAEPRRAEESPHPAPPASKDDASLPACDDGRPGARADHRCGVDSATAQPVSKTVPYPVTGKVTFSLASPTLISRRWSSANRALSPLVRLPGKDTNSVVRALTRRARALPQGLMSSLTWDRGMELAAHKSFSVATNVRVYFCDPHSPWQRGSNENTNGLLRQYFPDGTDLSTYTQANLNAIARRLNMRPRKTLGYNTPADRLAACVASTP